MGGCFSLPDRATENPVNGQPQQPGTARRANSLCQSICDFFMECFYSRWCTGGFGNSMVTATYNIPSNATQNPHSQRPDPTNATPNTHNERSDPPNANQNPHNKRSDPTNATRNRHNKRSDPRNATQNPHNKRSDPTNATRNRHNKRSDPPNATQNPHNERSDMLDELEKYLMEVTTAKWIEAKSPNGAEGNVVAGRKSDISLVKTRNPDNKKSGPLVGETKTFLDQEKLLSNTEEVTTVTKEKEFGASALNPNAGTGVEGSEFAGNSMVTATYNIPPNATQNPHNERSDRIGEIEKSLMEVTNVSKKNKQRASDLIQKLDLLNEISLIKTHNTDNKKSDPLGETKTSLDQEKLSNAEVVTTATEEQENGASALNLNAGTGVEGSEVAGNGADEGPSRAK